MHSQPPAVVMGNLMMGRCFTLENIPYIGITTKNDKRLFYSKACLAGYALENPSVNEEATLEGLIRIGREYGPGLPLFYTNDAQLKLVNRHADVLHEWFVFTMPEKRLIDASLDKHLFDSLAAEYHLPVPPTFHKDDVSDPDALDYPVIIKPTSRIHWFQSSVIKELGSQQKILLVEDAAAFKRYKEKIDRENIDYIVQKYVRGSEAQILSFHGFYDEHSEPLGYYCGRKIRTYPYDYGLSCSLTLIEHEAMTRISLDILKRLNFKGPIKIDYKLDEQSGELYLLELNPRYNMWHYIGARAGINLPALAWRYLAEGRRSEVQTVYETGIKWISGFQELLTFRDMKKHGLISTSEWLRSLSGHRIYQTYAPDDLKPVVYAAWDTFKGGVRKIRKIF
ncbi:MAG: hypothetical protein D6677_14205 [Calditrichaeota bacterium]|nr:MAG: hypothetical protein D6677_14205 [Calditrichota bacterium]